MTGGLCSWIRLPLAAAFFCAALPALADARAPPSIDALLQQAQEKRTSDPKGFRDLLGELDARRAQADPQQREMFRYLDDFAIATTGDYPGAIEDLKLLLDSTTDVSMKVRAGALIVNSYAVTREFADALRQIQQTLDLVPQVADPAVQEYARLVAVILYNAMDKPSLALGVIAEIESRTMTPRTQCLAGQLKLAALEKQDRLSLDDASIERRITQCEAVGELIYAGGARETLARKWAAQGQRDKAIALLKDNLEQTRATHYPALIGDVHALLAKWLLEKGDLGAAERHARLAIAQVPGEAFWLPLVAAYKVLYEVAEQRHDTVAALDAYRKYSESERAQLNDVSVREMAYQVVIQETRQKNQQIELLNRRNEALALEQKVDRQSVQNTRLIAILLAVILASGLFWIYRMRRAQHLLRRWAETDSLTGLCNRHSFHKRADAILERALQGGESVALIMLDLDRFKAVNDEYGHMTGDWSLVRVAQECETFCREGDLLARLGGEEFAFLLRRTDLVHATDLAERCRIAISKVDTERSGYDFSLRASFGVVSTEVCSYDLADLLSCADDFLYAAKRNGRNQVCSHAGGKPEGLPCEKP